MSGRKDYDIPDCPKLSKYDGLGSAGANLMHHDRVAKEGYRPGDCTTETITIQYHSSPSPVQPQMERYREGFRRGYIEALKDIQKISKVSDIDLSKLFESKGGYLEYSVLATVDWKIGTFKNNNLI